MAQEQSFAEQTVVEEGADGSVIVHRHIREWAPHAPETLAEIEATIDSWDRRVSAGTAARSRPLDLDYVATQVDRLTRRVKGTRKEVVTETVTEWVEGPVGSGPINVEDEEPSVVATETAWEEPKPARESRPVRRFSWFRPKVKDDKSAGKPKKEAPKATPAKGDKAETGYQPQCSALTDDGAQCRNSARHGSKYCAPHFGYQPPTTKGLAKRIEGDAWDPHDKLTDRQSVASRDTRPAVRKAPDTRLRTRKAAKPARKGTRKKR